MKKYRAIEVSCGDEVYNGLILDEPRYQYAQTAFAVLALPYRKKPTKLQRFAHSLLTKVITSVLYVAFYGIIITGFCIIYGSLKTDQTVPANDLTTKYVLPTPPVGEMLFGSGSKNAIISDQSSR